MAIRQALETVVLGSKAAAVRELERIRTRKEAVLTQRAARVSELAALEGGAGDAILDDETDSKVVELGGHIARLRAEISSLDRAVMKAGEREQAAVVAVQRAEIDELRSQAKEKREQGALLATKTGKLLAQLSEIEGVSFTHVILAAQVAGGGWHPRAHGTHGLPLDLCSPGELQGDPTCSRFAVTTSKALWLAAQELDRKASELERTIDKQTQTAAPEGVTV